MSYCLNPQCPAADFLLRPENKNCPERKQPKCSQCGHTRLLKERFLPLRPFHQGSFGRTFVAVDHRSQPAQSCLIKQFFVRNPQREDVQKSLELFHREAQWLKLLGHHPQIPGLLGHFEQEGHQYTVQELILGRDLSVILRRQGYFPEQEVQSLLMSLLPVLEFLHCQKIVHRDVKSENLIRRDADQAIVLVDFGAAKKLSLDSLFRGGTLIGSQGYAAPEQVLGHATFCSDLYSLGVTCVELLTAQNPKTWPSQLEALQSWRSHLKQPVSSSLLDIVDKLLHPDPNQRYQQAVEVLQDLRISFPDRVPSSVEIHPVPTLASLQSPASVPLPSPPPQQRWRQSQSLHGHEGGVNGMVFWPTGLSSVGLLGANRADTILLSAGEDGCIKLWSILTGARVGKLTGHSAAIRAIALRPDGLILATASADRTLKLWSLETGSCELTLRGHQTAVNTVVWSPDGRWLMSGGQEQPIRIWDTRDGCLVNTLMGHPQGIWAIAISPDGHTLVSAGNTPFIRLWDFRQGTALSQIVSHQESVEALAVHPNGELLVSGGTNGTLKLWDLTTGQESLTFSGHQGSVRAIAFSPNGKALISGGADQTLKTWQMSTGQMIDNLLNGHGAIQTVTCSTNNRFLASGNQDGTIQVWQFSQSPKVRQS